MSWEKVALGDVVTFRGGGTPRKDVPEYWGSDIPWATVKDFKSLSISSTEDSISRKGLESSAANLIPAGHVIIPTRMALGKAAINTIDVAINQDLRALIPRVEIDPVYLLHSMLGLARIIERNGSGATVKGITQDKLGALQIPLPPLAEQKRIAAILDAADALRAKRRQTLAELDTLLQSNFLDMFGDPVTNPKGWEVKPLGVTAMRVTDGTHQSPKWSESGIPFLFVSNIQDRQINLHTSKFISEYEYEVLTARCPIEVGDVLYTIVGSYGNPAMVREGMGRFAFQRHIAHIKPNPQLLDSRFLEIMLDSPVGRKQADRFARGVAQKTLNLRELKAFEVFVPPLALQQKFAAIVESVEQQKARLRAHLTELDTLFAALQSRAFKGEL